MIYLFESELFSTVFAISLRGAGRHTKAAGTILTIAVGPGAMAFPFVQYAVAESKLVRYSYCVLVALFAAGAVFPLYLNLVPAARKQVDPVKGEYLRRRHHRRRRRGRGVQHDDDDDDDDESRKPARGSWLDPSSSSTAD